jgi:hypothetical protein
MECVHLKEQPERRQHIPYTSLHLYSEILEQVILKPSGKAKSPSVNIPEVTSMQVCECIGEEWKSPLQISLLEVCLPQGVQGL